MRKLDMVKERASVFEDRMRDEIYQAETNTKRERWREEGRLGRNLGTKGMTHSIPEFSFCLVYPRLSAKELSNLETPVGAIKISTKSLLSSKRTKKGPDQQEKKLYNNIIRLQSNSTDKMWCTFTLVTKG